MQIKAEQKYIRMSPRKVKLVVDAIRSSTPKEALTQLSFISKEASVPVAKTIKQAIANATNNQNIKEEDLKFKSIQVKKGAVLKRWQAVSRGRAHSILKRTSHIMVILEAQEEETASKPSKVKGKTTKKKASTKSVRRK